MKTLINGYTCNRESCRHTWTPRAVPRETDPPTICPRCKSKRWDMPTVILIFAVASWDYEARLISAVAPPALSRGAKYVAVSKVEEVYKYPTDSRTLVLFTSNWYVLAGGESVVPAVLTERGYTCVSEAEVMG